MDVFFEVDLTCGVVKNGFDSLSIGGGVDGCRLDIICMIRDVLI